MILRALCAKRKRKRKKSVGGGALCSLQGRKFLVFPVQSSSDLQASIVRRSGVIKAACHTHVDNNTSGQVDTPHFCCYDTLAQVKKDTGLVFSQCLFKVETQKIA